MLRSCKELVSESCKYIESLSDIATRISISVALITMYQSVMKHSESYMQQHKDKNGKTCIITSNKINISNYQTIKAPCIIFNCIY